MNQVETDFLRGQENVPLVWFYRVDYVFFYGLVEKMRLKTLRKNLTNFILILALDMSPVKNKLIF